MQNLYFAQMTDEVKKAGIIIWWFLFSAGEGFVMESGKNKTENI